jgi:hypothetical protein
MSSTLSNSSVKSNGSVESGSVAVAPSAVPEALIKVAKKGKQLEIALRGKSLKIFSPTNPLRRALAKIVVSTWFEIIVLVFILFSSVLLALEYPQQDKDSDLVRFIGIMDYVFFSFFALEMLLKIIVHGFVGHKGAYLRDFWNVLDAFVVLVGLLDIVLNNASIKFLRSLRALRPLRLISRNEGMKVVALSVTRSIPPMLNVVMVLMLFVIIFAIFTVSIFGGKLFSCSLPGITKRVDCLAAGGNWVTNKRNYNSVLQSMLVLFEITTFENWPLIMNEAVDAVSYDEAPRRDYNQAAALFFVAYLVIIAFFGLSLFIGVISDSYDQAHRQLRGSAFLTPAQREWLETQEMMLRSAPQVVVPEPQSRVRRALFRFCTHRGFELAILVVIFANIVVLALEHRNQSKFFDDFLATANLVFVAIFTAEAVLKMFAMGPIWYLRGHWNKFDLFIVLASILNLVFQIGFGATLFRLMRALRVIKVVRSAKGLRVLFRTLLYSLASLWNVGAIVILALFVFAVAGVSLYGKVQRGTALNDQANFDRFPIAVLTLFRCATGENWNDLMRDLMVVAPDCEPEFCGSKWAFVYFLIFETVFFMILLNLFVGVILDNFAKLAEEAEAGPEALTSAVYDNFAEVWSRNDPKRTYFVPTRALPQMMLDLRPPLGLGPKKTMWAARRTLLKLHIPDHKGLAHFAEVQPGVDLLRIRDSDPPTNAFLNISSRSFPIYYIYISPSPPPLFFSFISYSYSYS